MSIKCTLTPSDGVSVTEESTIKSVISSVTEHPVDGIASSGIEDTSVDLSNVHYAIHPTKTGKTILYINNKSDHCIQLIVDREKNIHVQAGTEVFKYKAALISVEDEEYTFIVDKAFKATFVI